MVRTPKDFNELLATMTDRERFNVLLQMYGEDTKQTEEEFIASVPGYSEVKNSFDQILGTYRTDERKAFLEGLVLGGTKFGTKLGNLLTSSDTVSMFIFAYGLSRLYDLSKEEGNETVGDLK